MYIRKTVGIDLGTTNSLIAIFDATDSKLITGSDGCGRALLPSVVAWHPDQHCFVAGRAALALRESADSLALCSVKRWMGQQHRFSPGPNELTPPEASALILGGLRDQLARSLADARYRIDRAVIAVPAYFDRDQVEATRRAGEQAGFEVAELLAEPAAAAIYYSRLEKHGDATYLVYHLGGGTFAASIVRHRSGACDILGISGDPFLGGDGFDRVLAAHWLGQGAGSEPAEQGSTWNMPAQKGPLFQHAALFDRASAVGAVNFARLVQLAEQMKVELTEAERVERFAPPLVGSPEGNSRGLKVSIERSTFEHLIKDQVDRTITCCHEALARAQQQSGVGLADIDYVLMVGGSSRVPVVRQTVRDAFCNASSSEHVRRPELLVHKPDFCVAYGAALRGAAAGSRYVFPVHENSGLELHLTSATSTHDTACVLSGVVQFRPNDNASPHREAPCALDGFSVRIRPLATGLVDETFLDPKGTFAHQLDLEAESDNAVELTLCDGAGSEIGQLVTNLRHQSVMEPLKFDSPTELRELLQPVESAGARALDPPWPRFTRVVRRCLDLAAELADRTGREREELFEHVRAQERYAENARAERNQGLYHECWDNLVNYAGYLDRLCRDAMPRSGSGPRLAPPEEARDQLERFRAHLSAVWKKARAGGRDDLESRLREVAGQAGGLTARVRSEPDDVLGDLQRLGKEVANVERALDVRRQPGGDDDGLLEGIG